MYNTYKILSIDEFVLIKFKLSLKKLLTKDYIEVNQC